MQWTVEDLAKLPREDGFRLRGQQVTRLETFVDAAFAFALMALMILLLNRHALRRADELGLDALERHEAATEVGIQAVLVACAALSIVASFVMMQVPPEHTGYVLAGLPMFTYPLLGVIVPIYATRRQRARPAPSP